MGHIELLSQDYFAPPKNRDIKRSASITGHIRQLTNPNKFKQGFNVKSNPLKERTSLKNPYVQRRRNSEYTNSDSLPLKFKQFEKENGNTSPDQLVL